MFQPHYFRGGMVWRDAPGLRRHKEYQDGFLTTSGELPLQSAAALQTNNNTLCLESFMALTLMLWCINIIVLENVTDVAWSDSEVKNKWSQTDKYQDVCDGTITKFSFFFFSSSDLMTLLWIESSLRQTAKADLWQINMNAVGVIFLSPWHCTTILQLLCLD